MIIHFQGSSAQRHRPLADQMFAQRADVFGRIKGWDVVVRDGQERDVLDEHDPLYVLSLNENNGVLRGSFRIVPTTGPTLLKLALRHLFEEPVEIESPVIWECTRFALNPDYEHEVDRHGVAVATRELMAAGCSLALESGVEQLMGVFERPLERIYRRVGWEPRIVTASRGIAVGLWDVSPEALERMRQRDPERIRLATAA